MRRFWYAALPLATALSLASCGGGSATSAPTTAPAVAPTAASTAVPTEAPAADGPAKLVKATFAQSLDENQAPVDETDSFAPGETVYFSMEFDGRPKEGKVEATFFFRDSELATANVDFADANSGVFFSFGESTFAGFNLTTTEPLPISDNYRVEATLNGKQLDSYPFKVVAPADALASKIIEATLARGATDNFEPVDPATEFAPDETVFLVASADLGNYSWVQADWYVDGKLVEAGTRSLTMKEDMQKGGFSFSFLPEGGWPVGEHEVALTLNDKEIDRYAFTIAEAAAPTAEPVVGSDVELTSYSSEDGVFTIETPGSWQQSDASESGVIAQSWISIEDFSGALVQITTVEGETSSEELVTQLKEFVQSTFGSDPEFTMGEAEEQTDGSQRIIWNSTSDFGTAKMPITGLTFIEQRGDKLSLLTIFFPTERTEELNDLIVQVLNSYKIDPDATIK